MLSPYYGWENRRLLAHYRLSVLRVQQGNPKAVDIAIRALAELRRRGVALD